MNTWIILLFLLCCNPSGCGCSQNNGMNRRCRDFGCDNDFDRDRDRGRGRGCDCDHDHDHGHDCKDSKFEPRFDARPFSDRETCGCEENHN
ncbi:MAG: hypothetical protein K2P65_01190 [Lachnospiraceae bacterium]|nr:hypothetical protein [Lachnospiraceae bacterium]